jgi:TRAP-type transport system small permease protein
VGYEGAACEETGMSGFTTILTGTARHLDRLLEWLDQVVRAGLVLMMAGIFSLLVTQVLLRYVIHFPLAWIEELATFLAAYLTLFGASVCLRAGSHVSVDTLYRAVPELPRRLITILVYMLVLYFCWALHVGGQRLAWLGVRELSDSGYFYQYWPRMALVLGAWLLALQAANLLFQEIVAWITGERYDRGIRRGGADGS